MTSHANAFYAGVATCPATGKAIHETRRAARMVRNRLNDGPMAIYRCGDHYHLGHKPRAVRRGELDKSEWLGEA